MKWRRAVVVHASVGGNTVGVIATLVAISEGRVREMIHRLNDVGMESLDPQWARGRPRLITIEDVEFIVETAKTRPETLDEAFTQWSIRKLARYLSVNEHRVVKISREWLRRILGTNGVTFQRTKTWKESNDPDREVNLDRIDHVITEYPDRTFAFDEFRPLAIHPTQGSEWALVGKAQRQPTNYHKPHGVRQFHGCHSVGDDTLFGVVRHHKSADNTQGGSPWVCWGLSSVEG